MTRSLNLPHQACNSHEIWSDVDLPGTETHTHQISILSHASPGPPVGWVIILPPVPGPAGPVCTAAVWSPGLCRRPTSNFHEVPSGLAGSCDVPEEQVHDLKKGFCAKIHFKKLFKRRPVCSTHLLMHVACVLFYEVPKADVI